MNTDLTELRRLLDEGTPRPWVADHGIDWEGRVTGPDHYGLADTYRVADAQLIAAAMNALPDLLDAAEALERVKEMHHRPAGSTCCGHCMGRWPCDAIRAIDGERSEKEEGRK